MRGCVIVKSRTLIIKSDIFMDACLNELCDSYSFSQARHCRRAEHQSIKHLFCTCPHVQQNCRKVRNGKERLDSTEQRLISLLGISVLLHLSIYLSVGLLCALACWEESCSGLRLDTAS